VLLQSASLWQHALQWHRDARESGQWQERSYMNLSGADPWPLEQAARAAVVLRAIQAIHENDANGLLVDLLIIVWPVRLAREQ
jgi:hypothetical protein